MLLFNNFLHKFDLVYPWIDAVNFGLKSLTEITEDAVRQ